LLLPTFLRTEGLGDWRDGDVRPVDSWNVFHSDSTALGILLECDKKNGAGVWID